MTHLSTSVLVSFLTSLVSLYFIHFYVHPLHGWLTIAVGMIIGSNVWLLQYLSHPDKPLKTHKGAQGD